MLFQLLFCWLAWLGGQDEMSAPAMISNDSLYTLPVVIHVIHKGTAVGAPDNPADSLILTMLSNLNNAFRKNGPEFGGVDIEIQFALATRGPNCKSTTAINRIDGSIIPNYVTGGIAVDTFPGSAPERSIKALSRWPNTDYVNIWIVHAINGNSFSPGGFAYFPEFNQAAIDGLVLQASVVDGNNKTIVHELGHYLFLYHTFQFDQFPIWCSTDTACAQQGDLICDTEPHEFLTECSVDTNSCSGNPWLIADSLQNYTVLNNYMGFTSCQWMFTVDQKDRMRWALLNFRPGLLNSGATLPPDTTLPSSACTPSAANGLSPFYGVQRVKLHTLEVYSNSSLADSSFYLDRTCNQRVEVDRDSTYALEITGSYFNPHRMATYLDYNDDGDFDDADELLFTDWTGFSTYAITIPDDDVIVGRPLRLRIVADHPVVAPTACQLTGTPAEGVGQVEDYSVVIRKKQIFSLQSGDWNDPATWSCGCIPQIGDDVMVQAGHVVVK